jgi:4-amino-4-deoxy-L-arabinose transferase-like glycosyltransferase
MTTITAPSPAAADELDDPTVVLADGPPGDPRWARPALAALLVATAVLYLWGLSASGWANTFYSAAVQAGARSWKAFLFGSSDAANFISVDKPPASLWVMELSARVFGVSSWSILVPQALEGVAAVALLYATVKRWFGAGAGLLAGAILATTPVAALMFRFNNPDALLVLLLTAAAYTTVRGIENGRTRWIAITGALIGVAFLAKMMQAFLVVPAFGGAYLLAAPGPLMARVRQLLVGGATMVASFGWWVALVELLPASARPYVGGSQDNSVLNLIFGYNGFGRLSGNETGSVGGGGQGGSRWGITGWARMFGSDFGGQISFLLPAALVLLVAVLVLTARRGRTDRTRAALVVWGGWLLITAATLSLGQGIIHPYYAIALAPAIGAVVAIGAVELWRRRHDAVARGLMAAAMSATAWWAVVLLQRSPSWNAWLRPVVLLGGLVAAAALLGVHRLRRGLSASVVALAVVVGLAVPFGYTLTTVRTAHAGSLPSAGPAGAGGGFGGGGPGGGRGPAGAPPFAGGQAGGFARPAGATAGGGGNGGVGGLLTGSTASAELRTALLADAGSYTWVAATIGANSAAGYQLATDKPVMALGGFNGTDPYPTLAAFQALVRAHKVHYFIAGGGGMGGGLGGGSSTSSAITSWVTSTFTAQTIGGTTVYDLSGA